MLEVVGFWLVVIGAVMVLAGLLWLVRLAWKTHKLLGIMTFVTMPIGPLVFGLAKFKQSKTPLSVVLLGLIVGAVPYWYSGLHDRLFGRQEQVREIGGETYLNLTGADHKNYDRLKTATEVVALEMSNADAARAMQALNGADFEGRALKVNEAQALGIDLNGNIGSPIFDVGPPVARPASRFAGRARRSSRSCEGG